jgi:hypothetical protein
MFELYVAQERVAERERQIKADQLVQEALAGREPHTPLYGRILLWAGTRLFTAGQRVEAHANPYRESSSAYLRGPLQVPMAGTYLVAGTTHGGPCD